MKSQLIIAVAVCSLLPGLLANDTKRGEESKYTKSEAQALVKLRNLVENDLYLDYMHRDEYLISWLRTRKLDVGQAAELLRANLKWRKEEKVDDLENEAFPQFEKSYPYDIKAHDREGRPVTLFLYPSWDVRKAVLSGQLSQLKRYMIKTVFEVPQQIARREGQADGTNATQFLVLVDLAGYNLRQHACVRCFEMPLYYIQIYEAHYPQAAWQSVVINNPSIFDPVITLTKPFFSEHFSANLHLLGPDKEKWKKSLDTIVSPEELPSRFGGTHPRKH